MHTAQNDMSGAMVGLGILSVVKLLLWFFFLAIFGFPWSLEVVRVIAGAFTNG